jgi:hypothetical protein
MIQSRAAIAAAAMFAAAGAGLAFQGRRSAMYEREMQNPVPDPPDANVEAEFAFARLRYRSPYGGRRGGWGTDSNKAERVYVQGLRRLTRIDTRSAEEIIDADSDEMYNWPFLYAVEVGRWYLNEPQAERLREFIDRGGFFMVDDFHGTYEWDAFMESFRRVFPASSVIELENSNPIFHVLFDLDRRVQVPGHHYVYSGRTYERDGVEPRWRAVLDSKGRVAVAICHNMDLGDAWEWADDPQYPEEFASLAYRIGINYLVYAMTH